MRKLFRAASLAAALLVAFAASPASAWADKPAVEIIALSHWPVQDALKPVREMLVRHDARIRVVELDGDSPAGVKRLKSVGLKGHIPIVMLIDGRYRFERPGGGTVDFVNFPANVDNPMGLTGGWTVGDVEAVLAERLR